MIHQHYEIRGEPRVARRPIAESDVERKITSRVADDDNAGLGRCCQAVADTATVRLTGSASLVGLDDLHVSAKAISPRLNTCASLALRSPSLPTGSRCD